LQAERTRVRLAGRALAAVLAAGFVALLAYGVLSKGSSSRIDDSLAKAQATPAPGFDLALLQRGDAPRALAARLRSAASDGRVSLRELRGTPIVLNFWASWCVPCRDEAPLLERGWKRYRDRGALVLGLDMQDISDDARTFAREVGMTYPVVRDRGNDVARSYGVSGVPETYFVSRRGDVVGHVIGAVSAAQLESGIAAAQAGRPVGVKQGGARRKTR
jgi:cytochrome c biogenesis protein CcmG/thiol:disulfide interchange protein DsbE